MWEKTNASDETLAQQQLQTRFELILCELLRHKEYRSLELRNEIEDLLMTAEYEWKNGAFGLRVPIDGFRKLIEEIRQKSVKNQTSGKTPADQQKQV